MDFPVYRVRQKTEENRKGRCIIRLLETRYRLHEYISGALNFREFLVQRLGRSVTCFWTDQGADTDSWVYHI